MKRFCTIILVMLMTFSFLGINAVYAEEYNKSVNELYLDTEQISQAEIDYFNSQKLQ